MWVTSCGYLAMKWKHNYTREVLLSLHFLSSSLSCAPLLSGGTVPTWMHWGAALLSVSSSQLPSLRQSHTQTHAHRQACTQTPKTLCNNHCQGRPDESEKEWRERMWARDGPDSWIKVKQIDGSETQRRKDARLWHLISPLSPPPMPSAASPSVHVLYYQ